MKAHEDDHHPGNLGEDQHVLAQQLTHRRRRRAERHEDGRESEDEQDGGHRDFRRPDPLLAVRLGEFVERVAGDVAKIGRHQRQDAGRQEAQDACQEGGADRYVHGHAGSVGNPWFDGAYGEAAALATHFVSHLRKTPHFTFRPHFPIIRLFRPLGPMTRT